MVTERYLASFPLGGYSWKCNNHGSWYGIQDRAVKLRVTPVNIFQTYTHLMLNFAFQADSPLSEEYAKADERN